MEEDKVDAFLERYGIHSDTLAHYGKRGMKWGVRKDPSKAFAKSVKKAQSIDRKVIAKNKKGAKLQARGLKTQLRGIRWAKPKIMVKGLRIQGKGAKLSAQAATLAGRGRSWERAMSKNFKDVKVSDISEKSLEIGKEYTQFLLKG